MVFKDKMYFLSNMYPCSVTATYNGTRLTFTCVESAFQACKCMARANEFTVLDGYQAKKLGRQVPLRSDWNDIRVTIMDLLVRAKFEQNPTLIKELIHVEGEITEENTWNDTFWGISNGVGENNLGKILTKLRDEYLSNTFLLLIAGSRTFNDYSKLCEIADNLLVNQHGKRIIVVSGGAKGADTLAEQYAKERGYISHVMPADWNRYGNSAGYRRNKDMHRYIAIPSAKRGCICFWDGKSKGTEHNFELAKEFDNPIRIYNYIRNEFM